MKNFSISALLLSAASLFCVSAFAEGQNSSPRAPSTISNKTRADVKKEVLVAKRDGQRLSGDSKSYPEIASKSTKTRAEVRGERGQRKSGTDSDNYRH